MLVDTNSYIGHWPFMQRRYNTCQGRMERMDRFGVDLSVISNLNGIFYKNPQSANEELYDAIGEKRVYRERFIPFAVINPLYAAWRDHFETSTAKMGMRGIRLYPKYHGYKLGDPACLELVRRARDRGLPVAISLRMVDSRPSSWLDLERAKEWALKDVMPLIKAVPDAQFMILNVANDTALSQEDASLLKRTDFIMDTSGRNILDLGALIAQYGAEKFAFGTHAPLLDDVTALLRIASLQPEEADENVKAMIRSGNARRMLRI